MKKRLITFTIVAAMVLSLCSCTAEQATQTAIDALNSVSTSDSPEVLGVKNGYLSEYSTKVTVGNALDGFLSTPMWQYFQADSGEKIVQCTGGCIYQEQNVEAKVQFQLNDNDTFEVYTVAFNDISQNLLVISAFFEKIYEDANVSDINTVNQSIPDSANEETVSASMNLGAYMGDWSDGDAMGMSIEPETVSAGDATPFIIYRTRGKGVEYSFDDIKSVSENTIKVDGSYGFGNSIPCSYTIDFCSGFINLTISDENGENIYVLHRE